MSSTGKPAAQFGGPTIVLNGRRYAKQFCLFPYPFASSPAAAEDTNVLLLRLVGSGVPAVLGKVFWASSRIPTGFEEASAREGVVPSSAMDARTQADLVALADVGRQPCDLNGTTKCEACIDGCGNTTRCERAHYNMPAGGGDMIIARNPRNAKQLMFAHRPAGGVWSPQGNTSIPDVNSNENAGRLPNGRVYLAHNPCPNRSITGALRDPLVVSTSADGWQFDRAVSVMSCKALGHCEPRIAGHAKNPGPSYPQVKLVDFIQFHTKTDGFHTKKAGFHRRWQCQNQRPSQRCILWRLTTKKTLWYRECRSQRSNLHAR